MHTRTQRIFAIIGIVFLVSLYIFSLIAAIFNFDGQGKLMMASIFSTIVIPIMIWIFVYLTKKFGNKNPDQ